MSGKSALEIHCLPLFALLKSNCKDTLFFDTATLFFRFLTKKDYLFWYVTEFQYVIIVSFAKKYFFDRKIGYAAKISAFFRNFAKSKKHI